MMRVSAIVGGKNVPSARFRVRQYIPYLAEAGIHVKEHVPRLTRHQACPWPHRPKALNALLWMAKALDRAPAILGSGFADLVWLQRELVGDRFSLEGLLGRPFILDIDDAVWQRDPRCAGDFTKEIAAKSQGIIAGNAYLAAHFEGMGKPVWEVPTAVDTQRFRLLRPRGRGSQWVVGWSGKAGNLDYLYEIEPALNKFFRKAKDARLLVIADRPPRFKLLGDSDWEYQPWSVDAEVDQLNRMDVGIMPLPDTTWAKGKCSFKMLSYLAVGIPVVVSPVGMNAQVLAHGEIGFGASTADEWVDALLALYENPDLGARMGANGRAVVEKLYSAEIVADKLARIFREVGC